ncbi:hypothetical protein ACIREE_23775 [Streptomyces sp. NPDC102467]|uniref:hypothetical protein n=1 Tax=Streptomyces sp. NPDC102467 TaxID=3366179 RepID=UPI0038086A78
MTNIDRARQGANGSAPDHDPLGDPVNRTTPEPLREPRESRERVPGAGVEGGAADPLAPGAAADRTGTGRHLTGDRGDGLRDGRDDRLTEDRGDRPADGRGDRLSGGRDDRLAEDHGAPLTGDRGDRHGVHHAKHLGDGHQDHHGGIDDPGHGLRSALVAPDAREDITGRLQHAVAGFVDRPRVAVEEADRVLEDLTARLTETLAGHRQTLRTSWQDSGEDTERLRLALRDYRETAERLLNI